MKYALKGPVTLTTNSGDIARRLVAGDIASNKFMPNEKSQTRILSPETVACHKIIASDLSLQHKFVSRDITAIKFVAGDCLRQIC